MLYDIVFLILIIVFAIIGAKCGFSKVLSRVLSVISAFFISIIAANFLAELIYNVFIHDAIVSNINSALHNSGLDNAVDKAGSLLSQFPVFLANTFEYFGITQNSIANLMITSSAESLGNLFKTPVVGLISILLFILLFGFALFICSKLFKAITKLFRLPVIRVADTIAGFIFGLIEGVLIIYIITLILRILIPLSGGEWILINETYISESFVFSKLYFAGITNFFQGTIFRFKAI